MQTRTLANNACCGPTTENLAVSRTACVHEARKGQGEYAVVFYEHVDNDTTFQKQNVTYSFNILHKIGDDTVMDPVHPYLVYLYTHENTCIHTFTLI
jgi:hypothetical protein